MKTGSYADGMAALWGGHELGKKKSNWQYPSEKWIRDAEKAARRPTVLHY